MDPLSSISTRSTPQTEQADAAQVRNSAGGFSFRVTDESQALRFLILGTSIGSYYATEQALTKENAAVIIRLAADPVEGLALVEMIKSVSTEGRAARQNPTIFALAACAGSPVVTVRQAALAALPAVCRTGTHLFLFLGYVKQFRGNGRSLQRAVRAWYTDKPVDDLAYQMVKYRQREGWSQRDVLRTEKPSTDDPAMDALFDWAAQSEKGKNAHRPAIVDAYEAAQHFTMPHQWVVAVRDFNLPWEALPDAALTHPEVWEAQLPTMGITALMRNLGRMSKLGVIAMGSVGEKIAVERLTDQETLTKGRLHPLNILVALVTYQQGHGMRGGMEWQPSRQVIDALDEAFYLAFGTLAPANKRTLVGLDVSGSMGCQIINSPLTARVASAAMAMTIARTEPAYDVMGFSHQFVPIPMTGRQRLDDVLRMVDPIPYGRTDCALPMQWAAQNKVPVDTFLIYTDSETWHGTTHPHQALKRYRDIMGIDARLAVVGMVSNGFSIADPSDAGEMDVVGFDTATPDIIRGFSAREF